jgi:hypothetical protein
MSSAVKEYKQIPGPDRSIASILAKNEWASFALIAPAPGPAAQTQAYNGKSKAKVVV